MKMLLRIFMKILLYNNTFANKNLNLNKYFCKYVYS